METHPPVTRTRESQSVAVVAAVSKVCNDHHIIARSAVFPTMKCNHLISVIDVMDIDVLAPKTPRLIEPVAAQPNQVAIESVDTRVGIKFRPIERGRVAKVFIFKKLLALKDHGNTGSGKDKRDAESGTLPGKPTSGIARPDFFGHASMTIRHLVMRFRVNHPLLRVAIIAMMECVPNGI